MDTPQPSLKDTTSLMSKYNFINPVSVTVIYEEDEEKVKEINIEDKHVHRTLNQRLDKKSKIPHNLRGVANTFAKYGKSRKKINCMLQTVAQNMSYIVQCYDTHIRDCVTKNAEEVRRLQRKFITTKYRYFQRSFNIARVLLLSQRTNELFEQHFVKKVIELSNVKIDAMFVTTLYKSFIYWTEQKNSMLDQDSRKFDNVYQTFSDNNEKSNNKDNSSKDNRVTIFSGGPKGNEITLTVEAKYLDAAAQICKSNYPAKKTEKEKPKHIADYPPYNYMQCNSQINDKSQNKNNDRDIGTNVFNNLMSGCCNIDLANPSLSYHENLNNNINTMRNYNCGKQLDEEHISSYSIVKDYSMENQFPLNPLSYQMSTINHQNPNTVQNASFQGREQFFLNNSRRNVIPANINKNNYPTRQKEMQMPIQNIYPPLNPSSNMLNYPLPMPSQYNEINNISQRTNLHRATKYMYNEVNQFNNQNFARCNVTNTLPSYPENHFYNNTFLNGIKQTNEEKFNQEFTSRENGFINPVIFNSSSQQMSPTTYQNRPNWFHIQNTYVSNYKTI